MNPIDTLNSNDAKMATLYKDERDDGLAVYYGHGRMEWYRCDNGMPVDLSNYSYWS